MIFLKMTQHLQRLPSSWAAFVVYAEEADFMSENGEHGYLAPC